MSEEEITIDYLFHAEPHRSDSVAGIGDEPCIHCEHARLCATELMACCAFAAYTDIRGFTPAHERASHRVPSADWYAYIESEAPAPACALCYPHKKSRPPAGNGGTRLEIIAVLRDHPGADTKQVAQAINITRAAAKSALQRMMNAGLVEVIGYANDGMGHKTARWRLL